MFSRRTTQINVRVSIHNEYALLNNDTVLGPEKRLDGKLFFLHCRRPPLTYF